MCDATVFYDKGPVLQFFFNPLYRDVAQNWRGTGFAYLLLLLVITWIPITLLGHYRIHQFIQHQLPIQVRQLPQISIHQGKLSIDQPSPYRYMNPKHSRPFVVIDTSGQIKDLKQSGAEIFITQHQLTISDDKTGEVHHVVFADHDILRNLNLSHANVNQWIKTHSGSWLMLFSVVFFVVAVLCSFLYRVLQVLVYALIAMLFAAVMKKSREFDCLLRLCVVAITPAILLNTVLILLGFHLAAFYYLILSIIYIGVAVSASRDTTL